MATTTENELVDLRGGRHRDSSAPPDPGEDRGRGAARASDIPKAGWKDIALRVKDQIKEDQIPLLSAGVAFYLLLALFPALAAMVSIYGLVAEPDQVSEQVANLTESLPPSARDLITEQLESIVDGAGGGLGFALIAGVLAALWTASSGMKHLIGSINAAYDEKEGRGFLKLRGLALGLTLGAILFGAVSIGVLAVLPAALEQVNLGSLGRTLVQVATYPALAIAFGLGLAVLYRYSPDRDPARWRWVSWGAVIATVVWIVASIGFSFYAANFGSYGETYGTIGAVIVLMLWLVITAFAILLGAEIDSEIEAQTMRDSTVGAPEPMGRRDAVKADNVGEAAGS